MRAVLSIFVFLGLVPFSAYAQTVTEVDGAKIDCEKPSQEMLLQFEGMKKLSAEEIAKDDADSEEQKSIYFTRVQAQGCSAEQAFVRAVESGKQICEEQGQGSIILKQEDVKSEGAVLSAISVPSIDSETVIKLTLFLSCNQKEASQEDLSLAPQQEKEPTTPAPAEDDEFNDSVLTDGRGGVTNDDDNGSGEVGSSSLNRYGDDPYFANDYDSYIDSGYGYGSYGYSPSYGGGSYDSGYGGNSYGGGYSDYGSSYSSGLSLGFNFNLNLGKKRYRKKRKNYGYSYSYRETYSRPKYKKKYKKVRYKKKRYKKYKKVRYKKRYRSSYNYGYSKRRSYDYGYRKKRRSSFRISFGLSGSYRSGGNYGYGRRY